jgi:hypothetical protein
MIATIRQARVIVVAAAALAVLAAAAVAALPGLERVTNVSALNSNSSKGGGPNCPGNKKLLGAGGRIDQTTNGKLALDEITPLPNLTGVSVIGVETGGGTGLDWSVRGYAMCETNTIDHRLELKKADTAINSTNAKSATATCSAGKKVVGAGGQINTPDTGKVVLDEITPLPAQTSVTVVGTEVGAGTPNNWYATAYAICGQADKIPGLTLVSASSPTDSSSPKSVVAYCPSGKKATGGGGQINVGTSGAAVLSGIAFHAIVLDRVTAYGIEPSPGTSSSWSVKSYAICASP